MNKNYLFRKKVILFVILIILIHLVSFGIFSVVNIAPYENILGFISLLFYVATIIPGIFRTIWPDSKKQKIIRWLLKNRRYTGVAAFCFAANHGLLLIFIRQLNFLDYHTYIHYFQGLASMTIFTILAITSNDYSVKSLKANWKNLHKLTYITIFVIPWHIIDKMHGSWTFLTPISIIFALSFCLLFVINKLMVMKKPKIKILF